MKKLIKKFVILAVISALLGYKATKDVQQKAKAEYIEPTPTIETGETVESETVDLFFQVVYKEDDTEAVNHNTEEVAVGFATVEPDDQEDAFVGGMRMVYKQMMTELENINVKPIEAVGKEFDPNFHNAVMQVASEEYESGIVAQEFIKGYTYRDNVVRHSMVAVAE